MATSSSSSVQGLASGIQWQDLVDQLIKADTATQLTPLVTKATADVSKQSAWTSYGTAMSTLQTTLSGLMDGSVFGSMTVSAPPSGSTSRTLVTATATSAASPGAYGVQVLDTAAAQQLSGNVVADATAALGLSGQVLIAGKALTLISSDSLNSVRDKVNALNSGIAPTRVSASILFGQGSAARLVLSSDTGGASGLDLRDARTSAADPSLLTQLGFIDGKTTNAGADGAARSASFSSSSLKFSALTSGVTALPAASPIMVNGHAVTIDLQNNSLTDMAAAINAQSANSASVESTTVAGVTTYTLKIAGTVAASGASGSQPVLDLLGLSHGTTNVVKQQTSTGNVLQSAGLTTATAATALLGLNVGGANGAQSGDTFTITGTKPDGFTKVTLTETVDGVKTLGDMLADISAAFSATGRSVTAAVVGGRIQLTDDAGGDSGLSFSIAANNESGAADPATGAAVSFGGTTVGTTGRLRELAAGKDARLLVNGVLVTRNSNTITDAITGVTLNVQHAEVGTTIALGIARDSSRITSALQSVATSYNTLRSLVVSSTAAGGALAYNGSMRSSFNSMKDTLLGAVPGLATGSAYDHAALVGLSVDKTGNLSLDSTALAAALAANPDGVKAVFQTNGTVTGTSMSYLASSYKTIPGSYDVAVTRAATVSTVTASGSGFTYVDGGTADTMTIGDAVTGRSGSISLASGDTSDSVATKLNALFQSQSIRLTATTVGGALKISGLDYGSRATFTVGYTATDSTDVAGQLGIAAGTVSNGLDIAGKYSSGGVDYTATGNGQVLVGDAGSPVENLLILYSGASNSATGHVNFSAGVAGTLSAIADNVSGRSGIVATQMTALDDDQVALAQRQNVVQTRLDTRRAALLKQFTAMEAALSKIQSQGTWLTQQVNAMNGLQSSK
jgi:flagellar hook-associated protein 2